MKLQTNAVFRATTLAAASFALAGTPVHAITRTWDGGAGTNIWTTAANWNPDGLPVANDTVVIDTAVTVDWTGGGMAAWNVTLSNGASLRADVNYARLNGATINVGPTSTLSNTSGKGWDMNGGKLSFQNGAAAPIGDWELKGFNSFSFKLGPAGFTRLTPTTLRWQAVDKFTKFRFLRHVKAVLLGTGQRLARLKSRSQTQIDYTRTTQYSPKSSGII